MMETQKYETERDATGAIVKEDTLFRADKPQTAPIIPDVSRSFTSIVQIALNVLINPDVAYRADRQQQEQMLHDPMVMGPLQKRLLSTAQLEWEVVPEDIEDKDQVAKAAAIEKIIRRIPRFREFLRSLGMATFRGTGVSEINWSWDYNVKQWTITGHRPFHGDKITYDVYGNPRILTRQFQTGGRQLDSREKDRLVIHTFDRDDGDFYEGAEAGYVFKGRGLRDTIWPYWYLKHNAIRFWVVLLERYGTGFVEGRYPLGNKEAKAAIESVLQNIVNDSKFSTPVPQGADKDTYGIFVHKMEGLGESANLFLQFVEEWVGKHIRIVVEGQEQAHQTSGDGLGSGRAEALEDIFTMYRDYDAGLLEDTLTDQLVGKVQWFNYGYLPYRCQFKFVLKKNNYDEQQKRVQAAKDTGVVVPKKWVYETLDIPQPNGDEAPNELIDFGAMPQSADNAPLFDGGAGGASLFFDKHLPERFREIFNHKPENQ
jgi:phage gp29-like protein